MKRLSILLISFICCLDCISQITFEKTFGSTNNEQGFEFIQLLDSSYIIAGGSRSFGEPNGDFYLIKADKFGNLQWEETYGGQDSDFCYSFEKAFDGGYVLAGVTESFGAGSLDHMIVKVDSSGIFQWQKVYGGSGLDKLNDVLLSKDSNYYFLGYTTSFGSGGKDIQVLKTDIYGDTLWTKTYGDILNDDAICIIQSADSNILFTGWTNNYGASIASVLLNKIDPNGNIIWSKTYGGLFSDRGSHLIQTTDGGYMIAGSTQSSTSGASNKLYLIKTDNLGDTLWTKSYNNYNFVNSNYIDQTTEGGYIITGSEITTGSHPDLYLFKIDQNGNEEWKLTYGGSEMDYGLCVKQTLDDGFVVSGLNSSMGAGGQDVYLLKVNKSGTTAGINPVQRNQFIEIYPNPTTGIITINAEKIKKVEILNNLGKVVFTGLENKIDLKSFSKGEYILIVTTEETMFSSKLVKQ